MIEERDKERDREIEEEKGESYVKIDRESVQEKGKVGRKKKIEEIIKKYHNKYLFFMIEKQYGKK